MVRAGLADFFGWCWGSIDGHFLLFFVEMMLWLWCTTRCVSINLSVQGGGIQYLRITGVKLSWDGLLGLGRL